MLAPICFCSLHLPAVAQAEAPALTQKYFQISPSIWPDFFRSVTFDAEPVYLSSRSPISRLRKLQQTPNSKPLKLTFQKPLTLNPEPSTLNTKFSAFGVLLLKFSSKP